MTNEEKPKTCFVIAPIGDQGSMTRERSDKVLRHIIKPVAEECGYEVMRSDDDEKPGLITSQVIEHLLQDSLVVADLTEHNPNVFYELAIRHAANKPIVQLIEKGEKIPFDVSPMRTIQVDHTDLDSVSECKRRLQEQIHAVERDPSLVDSPLRYAMDLLAARQSENPQDRAFGEIMSALADLRRQMAEIFGVLSVARGEARRSMPVVEFDMDDIKAVTELAHSVDIKEAALKARLAGLQAQEAVNALNALGRSVGTKEAALKARLAGLQAQEAVNALKLSPASYRDVKNPLFDTLAQEAPPSGAEAKPQKRRRRPGKGSHKA